MQTLTAEQICIDTSFIHSLQVLLLENVRFHKEEEKNDPEFAKQVHKVPDTSHVPKSDRCEVKCYLCPPACIQTVTYGSVDAQHNFMFAYHCHHELIMFCFAMSPDFQDMFSTNLNLTC